MAWTGTLANLPTFDDGRINVGLISQSKRIELLAERGEKATGFPAEDEAKLQRVRSPCRFESKIRTATPRRFWITSGSLQKQSAKRNEKLSWLVVVLLSRLKRKSASWSANWQTRLTLCAMTPSYLFG